mgnify:CR=1 FL=1
MRADGDIPVSRRLGLRSGLLLIARRIEQNEEIEIPMPLHGGKPDVKDSLLMATGTNPRKMRKGKSGEIPRRGPR